ncbi:MAG: hypothetical protein RIR37_800 [Verrucomicrobiota bacterium]
MTRAMLFSMIIRVTRAMLVKLLGAVWTLELVTLAGNSKNAAQHQNREETKFHRAAS